MELDWANAVEGERTSRFERTEEAKMSASIRTVQNERESVVSWVLRKKRNETDIHSMSKTEFQLEATDSRFTNTQIPPFSLTSFANSFTNCLKPGIWREVPATRRKSGFDDDRSKAEREVREERWAECVEEGSS